MPRVTLHWFRRDLRVAENTPPARAIPGSRRRWPRSASRAAPGRTTCSPRRTQILTGGGTPFTVFSAYARVWNRRPTPRPLAPFTLPPVPRELDVSSGALPDAAELGFTTDAALPEAGDTAGQRRLRRFVKRGARRLRHGTRPAERTGTSHLSPYLRFGAVSIRGARGAAGGRGAGPRAWCRGETGYPIVDAAMRQLHATGWMHNRARMIVASSLTKDLLVDWRHGERYFMKRLVDGNRCAAFFHIFNPTAQGERFDRD